MENIKIAFITGASRGIGRAILQELAESNAYVIGTATTKTSADEITQWLQSNNLQGHGVCLDIRKKENISNVILELLNQFGKIDILVNNAAITRDQQLLNMDDHEWYSVIDTNLHPVYHLTKSVVRSMIKNRFGRIINVTSVVASMGNPGQTNYAATKSALIGFTKSLAHEISSRGITVNCVAPGFIKTDMTKAISESQAEALISNIPAGRMGSIQDVASAVGFLASDRAGYITGQTIHVNGGMYMA